MGDRQEQEALQAALAASMAASGGSAGGAACGGDGGRLTATPGADTRRQSGSAVLSEGMVAQDWLSTSSSQLTYYGLEQLHRSVKENELCVFFRNNHFSTLTKRNGSIFLLATDIGYLHELELVWEKLDQVDGDTILCDHEFRVVDLGARAASQAAAAAEAAEAAEVAAAIEAAEAAEMANAVVSDGGVPRMPGYPIPATHPHANASGGANAAELDPDYALALALQREEEDAADDEERRWQQQQQLQQQQLQQQQLQQQQLQHHPHRHPQGTSPDAQQTQAAGNTGGRRSARGDGSGGRKEDCAIL